MRGCARSELAARCGLQDAIGIPIAMGESGRGALLFFAGEIDEPQTSLLNFLTTISEQLGQFLEFHRTQQSLNDARQDLLQAKKMDAIGRLVGGVAHDFNNLLTIILGYGEIVLDDCEGNASNRELIGEVLDAGKRAAGLTKQLLGFCRKEAAEPTAVDLNAHIAEMQKMISRLIGEHITLTTSLATNAGFVRADPAHIEQVVMNLAVNARDAMPNGGTLSVETRGVNSGDSGLPKFARTTPGRYVLLSVSDSGCGMDEATRKRIFEPFFTTKESGKGTGMGLATVFEIIRQYEGQVEVESTPGRGTTFHILLPSVAQGLEPWQVDSRPVALPRGDEAILLVEDDDRVRQLMTRGLTAQGYRVLAAGDPIYAHPSTFSRKMPHRSICSSRTSCFPQSKALSLHRASPHSIRRSACSMFPATAQRRSIRPISALTALPICKSHFPRTSSLARSAKSAAHHNNDRAIEASPHTQIQKRGERGVAKEQRVSRLDFLGQSLGWRT